MAASSIVLLRDPRSGRTLEKTFFKSLTIVSSCVSNPDREVFFKDDGKIQYGRLTVGRISTATASIAIETVCLCIRRCNRRMRQVREIGPTTFTGYSLGDGGVFRSVQAESKVSRTTSMLQQTLSLRLTRRQVWMTLTDASTLSTVEACFTSQNSDAHVALNSTPALRTR